MKSYKNEYCKLCGVLNSEHPKCPRCHIGIGKGHIETSLITYKGKKICSWCFRFLGGK